MLVVTGALIKSFGAALKCPIKIIKAMAGIWVGWVVDFRIFIICVLLHLAIAPGKSEQGPLIWGSVCSALLFASSLPFPFFQELSNVLAVLERLSYDMLIQKTMLKYFLNIYIYLFIKNYVPCWWWYRGNRHCHTFLWCVNYNSLCREKFGYVFLFFN